MTTIKIILVSIFICATLNLKAQKDCYDCCIYKKKYNEEQRLKFYPFNIADTIKIVSFRYHWDNYYFSDKGLNKDSLVESVVLSSNQVDSLSNVLFNNFKRKPSNIGTVTNCFEPRNAILFIDKNGKIMENILICFHCSRIAVSSEKMYNFDQCSGKISLLLTCFTNWGIKVGTDLNINFYNGETPKLDAVAPPLNN